MSELNCRGGDPSIEISGSAKETESKAVEATGMHLYFSCGIIRGALSNLGTPCVVSADISNLPACSFVIWIMVWQTLTYPGLQLNLYIFLSPKYFSRDLWCCTFYLIYACDVGGNLMAGMLNIQRGHFEFESCGLLSAGCNQLSRDGVLWLISCGSILMRDLAINMCSICPCQNCICYSRTKEYGLCMQYKHCCCPIREGKVLSRCCSGLMVMSGY